MKTLIDLFNSFSSQKNSPALIYKTEFRRFLYSYRDVHEFSLKMASWLEKNGVKKGDRVVIWAPNNPWWVIAYFGILLKGSVVVPVDYTSGKKRVEQIIKLTKPTVILQSISTLEKLKTAHYIEHLQFEIASIKPPLKKETIKESDIAEIVYTSGSTGNPKGVILTHKNIVSNILQAGNHIKISKEYKLLSILPLSHMFEQTVGLLIPLSVGASIVYIRSLKPSAITKTLKEEEIYAVIVVPRLLLAFKNSIERELEQKNLKRFFSSIFTLTAPLPKSIKQTLFFSIHKNFGSKFQFFLCGGARLEEDIERFWNSLGFTLIQGYGLTETSPILSANTRQKQIVGSVGIPLQGVEIQIKEWEILAKGDSVFSGYYNNTKASNETFSADGWFKTGDLGAIDADKNLYIKGRKKEVIVTSSGVNVYPEDIEAILNRTVGVKESAVVGIDKGQGEEVHAVITLEPGFKVSEIISLANEKLDPTQKITNFSLWKDQELPKTTTLKIKRFQIKEFLEQKNNAKFFQPLDKLISILSAISQKAVEKIIGKSLLSNDLGISSIGRLELASALEQEFHIDFEEDIINQKTTVNDLRKIISGKSNLSKKTRFRYWTASPFGRLVRNFIEGFIHRKIFFSFTKLEVQGKENLKKIHGPVLFIANHLSYLDQPAIMYALPNDMRLKTQTATREEFFFEKQSSFIRKLRKEISFEYGYFGAHLFPFPQETSFRKTLIYMGWLIDHGNNILLFPEGERSKDGKPLPFKEGLGIIVKELQIPVIPIKIKGMEKIFPRGAARPTPGTNITKIGEPLIFTTETPHEIVKKCEEIIRKM